jgi:class 3 adenylate cyclase/tetratricopeptide (TPR) repeat protein
VATITSWLAALGLSEYAQRFAENDIDVSVLRHLTDQDLKELGVSLGHRRKMQAAIAELGGTPPATPQAAASPEPNTRGDAERRQLTVMFCDLVGSTALSARLDPEDLRAIIGSYHGCCAEVITKSGGFIAKYMGDGVLAYFGYPKAHEHDAERAVRAGLKVVEAVPRLATNAGSPLQVRVGIATGLVVVGDLIGAGAAQEQAVVGETPNLAARLQALAEPGVVVIASSTRRLTGGLFEYRDLGAVALKGFAADVPAWQVLGASAIESRFEAMRTAMALLVGRDEEIDLLLRRWEQAKVSDGQVVLISGEPGIGKSRIAETILERLSNEPHIRLRYFCSPHHQDSALYPSITQLERAAGFRREDTDDQRLAKLEAVLARGTNDLSEAVPLLADLLSIPTGARYPPLNLTPQKRKEKTLHAQLTQIEGLTTHGPVLMVWEDVHWSDPTTRESLDLLIERVATLRVFVIISFRPEFSPPWIGRPHVMMLTLNRLSPRQRAAMIKGVIGGKDLPKEIADQIIERTDGIPLFIEELTKAVIETGVVAEAGDHYQVAGPLTPLAIPTSLHGSLLARLDRLAPVREVAQIAAALGRQFSHELISAVASMPQQKLDDALSQLVQAELIFQRGEPPESEYTFKHALVQDAAYSTLLRSRRQQMHAQIATTLERQFSEIVNAQPQFLAHHYAEAGLTDRAVEYLLKAGQQSLARSAMTEAAAQLRKGLNLLGALPADAWRQQQELDLLTALGTALTATKGWSADDVSTTFTRARALAEQIGRREYLPPLIMGLWTFHLVRGDHRVCFPLGEQLQQIGEARNDAWSRWMGCSTRGITCFLLGQFDNARALLQRFCQLSDSVQRNSEALSFDPYALTLTWFALTLAYLGYIEQAQSQMNQALSEARRLRQAHTLAHVLLFADWLDWIIGAPMTRSDELIALTTKHGFPHYRGWGLAYRGWSLLEAGQPQEAVALLTQALVDLHETGNSVSTPMPLTWLAQAHAALGQFDEEQRYFVEAVRVVETTDERVSEAELLHRVRGDLLNLRGDRAGAERCYREAITVAKRQSASLLRLRASTSLARLWRDQGKRTEARDLLAPIYGWFTEGFETPVLKGAKAVLDELRGDPARAPATA